MQIFFTLHTGPSLLKRVFRKFDILKSWIFDHIIANKILEKGKLFDKVEIIFRNDIFSCHSVLCWLLTWSGRYQEWHLASVSSIHTLNSRQDAAYWSTLGMSFHSNQKFARLSSIGLLQQSINLCMTWNISILLKRLCFTTKNDSIEI